MPTETFRFSIRHKAEICQLAGHVAECPVDEVNRPRGGGRAALRIPPEAAQVGRLFAGWREELATCRKFAPAAPLRDRADRLRARGVRLDVWPYFHLETRYLPGSAPGY